MILIEYIDIEKLHDHPDNPRKDMGDLSELRDSIRENGIMQNLTVVPWFSEITRKPDESGKMDGHYRVVIGHRRKAAARLAGLTKLPCVIEEMDYKKQISTMLLENIQRSDLTPYEQAQGFQMMMDLGSTVADIVKDTGFSETTVRHRIKLAELDQEVLKEKTDNRNISIGELIELEKIKDPDRKNEVLKSAGTSNFNQCVKSAMDTEQRMAKMARIEEQLSGLAEKITYNTNLWSTYKCINSWQLHMVEDDEIDNIDLSEYEEMEDLYYTASEWSVSLYQKRQEEQEDEEEIAEKKREELLLKERAVKLSSIVNQMKELRMDFARYVQVKKVKENMVTVLREAAINIAMNENSWQLEDCITEILDMKEPAEDEDAQEMWIKNIEGHLKQYPELTLFQIVYGALEANVREPYLCNNIYYEADQDMRDLYEFLKTFGYEMSDEEKAIMNGTHELCGEEG